MISGPNYIWGQQSFKFTPEISFKFICLDHLGLWCLLVASKWPAQQLFKEQHQCKSTTATAISTTLAAAWLSTAVHLHWWCLIHHKFQWIRQAKFSLLNLIKPNFLSSVQNWKRKYAKVKGFKLGCSKATDKKTFSWGMFTWPIQDDWMNMTEIFENDRKIYTDKP